MVVVVGVVSLIFPKPGSALGSLDMLVSLVLAFMVLNVSMTIKVEDLRQIKNYPFMIFWSAFLQFVPMPLFALLVGKTFSHWPDISTGQLLLGTLPADVSAPLMVYLAGGNTALGTAMLVVAMALTPIVLPNVLAWFGGVAFKIPVSYLIIELAGIIVVPVVLGIFLNYRSKTIREKEQIWSGIASLCYIILLFVVVSSNAKEIISLKAFAYLILLTDVALNLFGYGLAYLTKLIFKQQETFLPMLFLVSSKEFGIASAGVEAMRLNAAMVIPSALYAVVQMISSPVMVKIIKNIKTHFPHQGNSYLNLEREVF
jgi:BASS family bile acid:Na+ symporter